VRVPISPKQVWWFETLNPNKLPSRRNRCTIIHTLCRGIGSCPAEAARTPVCKYMNTRHSHQLFKSNSRVCFWLPMRATIYVLLFIFQCICLRTLQALASARDSTLCPNVPGVTRYFPESQTIAVEKKLPIPTPHPHPSPLPPLRIINEFIVTSTFVK
jgi:hypothetical protein